MSYETSDMPVDTDQVLRLLTDSNPWWETKEVPQELTQPYRRRDFFVLRDELRSRPVTALGGPRQVGKTTLLYQLIEHLLESGVDPTRILFVSFDLPGLSGVAPDPLNDCMSVYAERVLGTPLRKLKEGAYVFLDEVTKVATWHRDLKGWFDFRYPLKFCVSSSSLPELRSGAASSLAGRIDSHLLLTWKFVDVLMKRTKEDRWNDTGLRLRDTIRSAVEAADARLILDRFGAKDLTSTAARSELRSTADRYMLTDGFPELLDSGNLPWCSRRLTEYLQLTLANDLYRFYQVRATRVFEDLLGLVARESGQLLSYRNLAETLGTQERTVIEYLDYLERTYLVSQAQFFSESRAKRIRRQRKIYLTNPGLRNSILGTVNRRTLSDPGLLGPLVEGLVHDHAKRLVYCLAPGRDPEAFYWRDRQNREVDIVVRISGKPLPIEVKYRTDPTRDLDGLKSFLEQVPNTPFGIVVTRDTLELRDNVVFVPLSRFLLAV